MKEGVGVMSGVSALLVSDVWLPLRKSEKLPEKLPLGDPEKLSRLATVCTRLFRISVCKSVRI